MATEGAAGSRRKRNSDVEFQHCRSIEKPGSFNAPCDYRPSLSTTNIRGRRLAMETAALRSPPMHRRTALKANLLTFVERLEFRGGPEL